MRQKGYLNHIAALLVVLAFCASLPAAADPDPPGPDFGTWLFGGSVHYQQAGLSIFVHYRPPDSVRQYFRTMPDNYAWQQGTTIPCGSELHFTVVATINRPRQDLDRMTIDIDHGLPNQSGWVPAGEPYRKTRGWVKHVWNTAGIAPGLAGMRAYVNAGDDQDNGGVVAFQLESIDSILARSGVNSQQPPSAVAQVPTGSVVVTLLGPPRTVSIWSNGQKVASHEVAGSYEFTNVPVGEVSMTIADKAANWYIGPDDFLADSAGNLTDRKLLSPGQKVHFTLNWKGGAVQ
ncbi:hypothetical protein HY374_01470 [Candidatus Berkelbacteria bacterium]|nr:hypothetical protein [Candidatus Berkelbacteria bacterium]